MLTRERRILISGGGIGGAALALALRHAGHHPIVLEARDYQGTQVGGCYVLWYAGVKTLGRLGVPGREQLGNPMHRLEMCDSRGRILFERDVGARGVALGGIPIAVRRVDLLRSLYQVLPEHDLQLSSAVRSFVQDDRGVTVTLTDGRELQGDALVGADGLHSTVRSHLHRLGPATHPGYAHWFGITTAPVSAPNGTFRILHGDGARFAFFRLDDETVCWWCVRNAPNDRTGDILGSRSAIAALTREWDPVTQQLIDSTPEAEIFRRDTFERSPLRRWGSGRVTLLGDAAHAMTFDLGQGAGTALTDAVTLADHLSRSDGLLRALRSYEQERRRVTKPLTWASGRIGGAAGWSSGIGARLNSIILQTIGSQVTPTLLERDAWSHEQLRELSLHDLTTEHKTS